MYNLKKVTKLAIKLIKNFIKLESAAGIILFAAALLAIAIDNSALAPYMEQFLETPFTVQFGEWALSKHLLHWINDGLMVLFFLLVGLEIKRELIQGELNTPAKVILPAVAALGGMLMPAIVFSLLNFGNDYAMRGWAIPTATDIAFSLGILSLLGSRIPLSLKVFLTALAIFDDMGAIIIIAIFYNADLSFLALLFAILCIIALFLLNRFNVRGYGSYFVVGTALWLSLLHSGVHATLAGVILALAIPLKNPKETVPDFSPSEHLVKMLHPWIAYFILPLFAFANAGVSFSDVPPGLHNILSPVMLGIALALLVGKLAGVFLTSFLAIKLGLVPKPTNSTWPQIFGIALVCGVGFTMSLFVGTLAYPGGSTTEPYAAWVRLGVILGSLLSGGLGYLVLRLTTQNNAISKNL
jgi:NhaA family Na+:H+ antiporter